MTGLLFLLIAILSFIIALALGWGSLGATIIFLLLISLASLIVSDKEKNDTQQLPDPHDERPTD